MASKRKLRWHSSATLSLTVERDGRRLAVVVTDVGLGAWNVIALEAAAPAARTEAAELEAILDEADEADEAAELEAMQTVLEDHAHQPVGSRSSPVEALQLAESYALGWLNAPSVGSAERCACGPIEGAAHG